MVFFRGPITSSPIKTRGTQDLQPCHSLDTSFLSDSSYECLSINPATGSLCVCRRSPRLLSNGYYVLTEDSVVSDDQGNLTLTPTQTNISYKENLARIFRRRRRVRKSLANLLSDVSQTYQSWFGNRLFGKAETSPCTEYSSWSHDSSISEQDTPISFTYDPTETGHPSDKEKLLPESHTDDCSDHELPCHSLTSLMDVLPPSKFQHKSYHPPTNPDSESILDKKTVRLALFFVLTLCIGAVVSMYDLEFSYALVFGVIAVVVASLLHVSHTRLSKSGSGLSLTKTEVITSRNE